MLAGLLSRVVPLRRSMSQDPDSSVKALKLLIMSATLRIDDFTANRRLFPTPPPVVHVPARQYPVTVHFNRRTELDDFEGAAHQKVSSVARCSHQYHKNILLIAVLTPCCLTSSIV